MRIAGETTRARSAPPQFSILNSQFSIPFLLILIAAARIASTYAAFSATVDEPMHLSAGLELYARGTNFYHPLNPPLPRAVLALAPSLGGVDFDPDAAAGVQLLRVFYSDGAYVRNLVLARAGNLVFFLIAAIATWLWARRELGATGGLIALLLFTSQPMILGHSALGTMDMAMTAGVAVSLFAFARWLDETTLKRALVFGAALGFAIACKLPNALYVPAACFALACVRRRAHANIMLSIPVAIGVLVALYGFRIDWLLTALRESAAAGRAPQFSYAFGQIGMTGWSWYFFAALALKTTLASLALALFSRHTASLAAALAILLVSMPTPLAVGVRYVLAAYVPLTVAAAATLLAFFEHRKKLAYALLAWHLVAGAIAHPDYFPYFNELAQPRPSRFLLDSNIDWGQDVLRLRRVAREKRIERLGVKILGWHDYDALGFPPTYEVHRTIPVQGWVAVSEHLYVISGGYDWLRGRRYERVGSSIRLYHIE